MNPYSGRLSGNRNRQVGRPGSNLGGSASSSTAAVPSPSQRAPKRQKLDHLEKTNSSKYFHPTPINRTLRPRPQMGPFASASSHRSDPIVIDEDDISDVLDDAPPSKRIGSKASSPDPMDLISSDGVSYAFDQNKPSPICQLSSSLEEKCNSPKDGESTARLRSLHNAPSPRESRSPLDKDGDGVERAKAPLVLSLSRGERPTARAEALCKPGRVQAIASQFDRGVVNLQKMPNRKNGMKPKPPKSVSSVLHSLVSPTAEWSTRRYHFTA
jgi:hypothetical protein